MPDGSAPHVVLGVCGGVAAYKAVELCRHLTGAGMRVSPVLTSNATRFVGEATFAALSSDGPYLSLWDGPVTSPHTRLGQSADVVVVAPTTARMLAALAHGLSSDLLSTLLIATRAPVVLAPAMHTEMWEHPSVQDNVALLRSRGVTIVGPVEGALAGGDVGVGRLAPTEEIAVAVQQALGATGSGALRGRRVLITAGGTREPIDAVRFIGNRSSGKQGYAFAEEASARGAEVVLVTTVDRPVPSGVEVIRVDTAAQLQDAVAARIDWCDVLVMAAAVADFRPDAVVARKLKKADGPPEVRLVPTGDVLATVAQRRRPDQVLVGFAAETDAVVANARLKLVAKRLDLVVANDVSLPGAGFEHDTNVVHIVDESGQECELPLATKRTVAKHVLDRCGELLVQRSGGTNRE